jgi:hypothetical protein
MFTTAPFVVSTSLLKLDPVLDFFPSVSWCLWGVRSNRGGTLLSFARSCWSVIDTTLCHKVCQWLATGRWFSPGTPGSSTYKTDCHDITEILLKVALNPLTLTSKYLVSVLLKHREPKINWNKTHKELR